MAHVLSVILVRNKNVTGLAGSVQAQLGCPNSAQLELDMVQQRGSTQHKTVHLTLISSGSILALLVTVPVVGRE